MTLSCEDFTRFLFRAEGFVASLWFPLRLWLQRFQKWNRKRSLTTLTMAAAVTQCANRWTASQLTVSLETRASYQTVAKVEPASQRLSAQAQAETGGNSLADFSTSCLGLKNSF